MDRIEVIQKIIDKKKAKNYIEIGIQYGNCFLKIKALKKIAVDPKILTSIKKKVKSFFTNYTNIFNRYYEETSDTFFETREAFLKQHSPEVVFIDGLHTYEQSLKDVYNSLKFLHEDGVIILHDCNPPSEAAAYPADSMEHAQSQNLSGWTGEWCGDVWKTLVHLKKYHPELMVFVLDCDYGLGVVYSGDSKVEFKKTDPDSSIKNLPYEELENARKQLLNLKEEEYLGEFLQILD